MKTYFFHNRNRRTCKRISSHYRQWVDESKIVVARVRRAQRYKVFCDEIRAGIFVCEEAKSAMNALCNTNFSFGRRSLCKQTLYAKRLHSVIYWDYLFLVCWANAKQTTHVPTVIVNIHIYPRGDDCVLFVTKTPTTRDNNGIVSSDFERKLHINKSPSYMTIATSNARRRRSKNPLNLIYGLFARSFAKYILLTAAFPLSPQKIIPAYFVYVRYYPFMETYSNFKETLNGFSWFAPRIWNLCNQFSFILPSATKTTTKTTTMSKLLFSKQCCRFKHSLCRQIPFGENRLRASNVLTLHAMHSFWWSSESISGAPRTTNSTAFELCK